MAEARQFAKTNRRRGTAIGQGIMAGLVVVAVIGSVLPLQDRKPPTQRTATCATQGCHENIANRSVPHQPVERRRCLDCHDYVDEATHTFRVVAEGGLLCANCHTLPKHDVVHAPVAQNDCVGCHDPHGSDHEALLVAPAGPALCSRCHEDAFTDHEFIHGPIVIGACLVCHDAHGSAQPDLLTTLPDRLCLDCHTEVSPTGAAARHRHGALDQGCTSCHDPHASDLKFQLREPAADQCLSCHPGVKGMIEHAAVVHGTDGGAVGCTGCHAPHFSPLPKLQRARQPELCLRCHDRPVRTADGRELTNMAHLLAENPNHHGPIRDGGCTGCHRPHASDHAQLLVQDYPPEFYAPFDAERYRLCFTCHLADLVVDESGTGLTGFRDGDRNLHWLHVNQEKGRTCRACHEVHASRNPFHMRDAVPFGTGGWMLKINYLQSETGGSCLPACHKKKSYSREAAIVPLLDGGDS